MKNFFIDLLKLALVIALIVAAAYLTGNMGLLKKAVFDVWDHIVTAVTHLKQAVGHLKSL